jgi:hypothetical protein
VNEMQNGMDLLLHLNNFTEGISRGEVEIYNEDAISTCRSLPGEIETFSAAASSLPKTMIKLRLTLIQGMVVAGERYPRLKSGAKTFVLIQTDRGSLNIRRLEVDILKGRESLTGSSGGVFLAPHVVLDRIEKFPGQVDQGELVEAVSWLSRYYQVDIDGLNQSEWHAGHERQDAGK